MNKTNHFSWLILRIGKYILNHLFKNSKIILKGYISLKWAYHTGPEMSVSSIADDVIRTREREEKGKKTKSQYSTRSTNCAIIA